MRVLPPEFVNRIDEIVPFRVLETEDMQRIARKLLETEAQRWRTRGKKLSWDKSVAETLALTGYDPRLGARHLERNLERLIISLLSDAAIRADFDTVRELQLSTKDGAICLSLDGVFFECGTPGGTAEPPARTTRSSSAPPPDEPGRSARGSR